MMGFFERDAHDNIEYMLCHTPADFTRDAVKTHNLTSFVINDIKTAFKDTVKDMKTWKDLSNQAAAEIGHVFGFNYSCHRMDTRTNSSLGDYEDLHYRCNQCTGGERKKEIFVIELLACTLFVSKYVVRQLSNLFC